jgi:hypothetical protein
MTQKHIDFWIVLGLSSLVFLATGLFVECLFRYPAITIASIACWLSAIYFRAELAKKHLFHKQQEELNKQVQGS